MHQHSLPDVIEHSDRKGTSNYTAESRTRARHVEPTAPYNTGHDFPMDHTAEGRRKHTHSANGHQAGMPVGLKAAVQHNLKKTRESNTSQEPIDPCK